MSGVATLGIEERENRRSRCGRPDNPAPNVAIVEMASGDRLSPCHLPVEGGGAVRSWNGVQRNVAPPVHVSVICHGVQHTSAGAHCVMVWGEFAMRVTPSLPRAHNGTKQRRNGLGWCPRLRSALPVKGSSAPLSISAIYRPQEIECPPTECSDPHAARAQF